MKSIRIGNKIINLNNDPYIIAEIGVNHGGSMDLAKKMISQIKKSGLNAAKFQTYKAENLVIKNSPAYWNLKNEKTTTQYKLFKKFDKFNKKEYLKLHQYCKTKKIDFLSTPFDIDSIKWLKNIMPVIKIASADINNKPLLKEIGKTNKTVLLSTGASNLNEIRYAIKILNDNGTKDVVIMHCILNYPTENINANLGMIEHLKKKFPNNIIGYSDHTLPSNLISPCVVAYQLGARVIEKHFTFNKKLSGNDHYHSMDFSDAESMIRQIKKIQELIGNSKEKMFIKSEIKSRKYARRSIVSKVEINKGDKFSENNLTTKRPGNGISPTKWDQVIGKKSKNKIKADEQIKKKNFT